MRNQPTVATESCKHRMKIQQSHNNNNEFSCVCVFIEKIRTSMKVSLQTCTKVIYSC